MWNSQESGGVPASRAGEDEKVQKSGLQASDRPAVSCRVTYMMSRYQNNDLLHYAVPGAKDIPCPGFEPGLSACICVLRVRASFHRLKGGNANHYISKEHYLVRNFSYIGHAACTAARGGGRRSSPPCRWDRSIHHRRTARGRPLTLAQDARARAWRSTTVYRRDGWSHVRRGCRSWTCLFLRLVLLLQRGGTPALNFVHARPS
jgi:hypothetical protein